MIRRAASALAALALAALILAGGAQGAAAGEADNLRVMTYNIRLDTADDGANAWPHRRTAVAALLRFYTPDLFGLQEVRLHQRDQLAADLPSYTLLGVGRDDGRDGGEFASLAFRTARFRLIGHGDFWLSPTPATPSVGWDAAYPRLATWARLADRRTGRRLLVLNTHWDHVGVTARLNSARLIRAWLNGERRRCESVVVLGDFNATREEASLRELSADYGDALMLSRSPPFGPAGTFNGFDILHVDAAPIDHVLVSSDVRVERYGVLTQHDAGRLPSDHYPVLADLSFPGRACE